MYLCGHCWPPSALKKGAHLPSAPTPGRYAACFAGIPPSANRGDTRSNPGNVDVVIGQTHVSGARLIAHSENLGSPISVPAGTVVGEGDIIKVGETLCKVVGVVHDCVYNKEMSVNIYTAPVEQ